MAFPIDTPAEMIGQLYVGYFGRAADPDGLNYWITQFNAGMSLSAIANSFAVQPEATALYSYLAAPAVGDPAAFVTAIYQDLFNRGPDAGGLAYWVNQLTVQGTPPGQMVLNIISGAQGADKTTIENKTHVAVDYAEKFVNNNLTWITIDNIQGARDVVTPVTSDPATVVTAIQQIDAIISQEQNNPQNIQLTPNLTTILSGGTVAITLKADPSQANKDFQYTITGVDSSVIKGGALSGTVKLGSDSTAVINIGTVVNADDLNTAAETIKVTVGPISTNVTLTEGVQTVSQPSPVTEGNAFSFTVSTTGIAAGSANGLVQTYTITGPGLAHIPVSERSGTVTLDNNGNATVTVHTLATLADSGTTSVTITVGNDTPINVVINETAVQTITPSSGTIQEGAQVVFKITTTGVAGSAVAGQVENWTLSGAAADQINGPLSGTVTLDQDGTATVTISTKVDLLNDLSPQDLVFTLLSGAVPVGTATVNVNQGSQVTTNTGPVNEGSAFSFTVTTSGVAPGSVAGRIESYTLTGLGIDHIPVAERSGTVVLDANGQATVTVHTLTDLAGGLGATTVDIQVGNNAVSTVTINETAQQTVTPNFVTILEGGAVVFTINTTGVGGGSVAGQVETWTLSGAAADQINGPLSGTVTLDSNGSATVTIQTLADALNDISPQELVFTLSSGATQTAQALVNVLQGTQVTSNTGPVNEGSGFSFTVTTSGVAAGAVAGRQETYTITGPGIDHIPVAQRSGILTLDANGSATISVDTLADLANPGGVTTVSIQVSNNVASTVTINESATQTVTPNSASILEGGSVIFTINTAGVLGSSVAGQVETWTLSGSALSQVSGPLSGTVTLDSNGSATVTVNTQVDGLNDGVFKDLVFTLKSGATTTATATVNVNQGTQTVAVVPSTVNEGSSFNIQVTTSGVAAGSVNGRTETYTITGPGIGQIPIGERTGTVTLDADGKAAIAIHTLATVFNSAIPDPTVSVVVGNNAAQTVTIHEAATIGVSASNTTITQGNSVTFTIAVGGVLGSAVAGTVQSWTLTGTGTSEVVGPLSGTITLDAAGAAVVTIATDGAFHGGPNPLNLTFNLFGNNGLSPTALLDSETITINQLDNPFVLTLGTDAGPAFTGNPAGGNKYIAIVNTLGSTLGQNDDLHGNSNVPGKPNILYLNSSGILIAPVNAFTTHDIQIFEINAGGIFGANGTQIDMSSAFGVTTINNTNSSQSLTLLNVVAPVTAKLTNPSDLGSPVNFAIQYQAAGALATSNQAGGQQLTLDPTVSPITGLPNSKFWVNVPNMTITSGGTSGVNGLVSVNGPTGTLPGAPLTSVTMNGAMPFVLGAPGSGIPGMAFFSPTNNTHALDLSALTGAFFNIGSPGTAPAITSNGNLTITGGAGGQLPVSGQGPVAMTSFYSPTQFNPFYSGGNQVGGAGIGLARATILLTGGSLTLTVDKGSFYGQQIVDTFFGGSVSITGAGSGQGGGFLGGLAGENSATIVTNNGAVTVTGLRSGLGNISFNPGGAVNPGSMIVTNTNNLDGANVTITNIEGGLNEQISAGTWRTAIDQTGTTSNNTVDFSQHLVPGVGTQHGFHKSLQGFLLADSYIGSTGTDTLIIDPSLNNNNTNGSANGIGGATGLDNLILQSPEPTKWLAQAVNGVWGGGTPLNALDLGILNAPTNVFIGGNGNTAQNLAGPISTAGLALSNATFFGAKSGENFFVDLASTGDLTGQTFAFDYAGTAGNTLNLSLQNNRGNAAQVLTVSDYRVAAFGNQNPVTRFNFNANSGGNLALVTLSLDTLNALQRLDLFGTNAMTVNPGIQPGSGNKTVTEIHGGDSNINIAALATSYLSMNNIGTNTITLGKGADVVTINNGAIGNNWTVNTGAVPGGGVAGDSGNSTFLLSPAFGQFYTVSSGGGNDLYTISYNSPNPEGGVGPGGGIVNLKSGAGNDNFRFNMFGATPGLNSAQAVDGGTGLDRITLFDGAVNQNDSLFAQIRNVEEFVVAGGFNNSLLLNALANLSGITDIFTSGLGSSNVFREGTGFTNPMHYHIADGDTGRDAIFVSLVSGTVTVTATASGFNTAFMQGLATNANDPGTNLPATTGIYNQNLLQDNTLNLIADGSVATIFGLTDVAGVNGLQRVIGKENFGQDLTVFLVNPPSAGSKVNTIDLSDIGNNLLKVGNSTVWGQVSTTSLTITGGVGEFSTLIGGQAGDKIVAQGRTDNWIWGQGGADTLTGAAGDPGPQTGGGTTFIYNTVGELKSGDTITNFHWQTDDFFINPAILMPQSNGSVFFAGTGATYDAALQLMVGGGTGPLGAIYSVWQEDTGILWFDIDNNGLLNASDGQIKVTWGSPPPPTGEPIFQTVAQFNTDTANSGLFFNGLSVVINALNNVTIPANTTLGFGQTVFGGPGINDTLTLGNNADIEDGNIFINTAAAFEHLVFDGNKGDVSVAQWNWFNNTPGNTISSNTGNTTVHFSNGWDLPIQTAFTTNNNIIGYNLTQLTKASTVTVANGAPLGTLITGSNNGDTYKARPIDLWPNWVTINAGTGADTLILTESTDTVPGDTLTFDPIGGGNVKVSGIESLILSTVAGAKNQVVFQGGGSFKNVTGTADDEDFITTGTMVAGGTISTLGDDDQVTLSSDLAGTLIDLGANDDVLVSKVGGKITTTLDGGTGFDTLSLKTGDDISGAIVKNFEAFSFENGATVTMTVAQWNAINPPVFTAGGIEKVVFVGVGGTFDTNAIVESYDLSALTSASTVNIEFFQNGGGSIVGSSKGDTFNADPDTIGFTGAIKILGGSGDDKLNLTDNDTLTLSGNSNGAGIAFVSGVENLFLDTGTNNITFANGTAFKNVTGNTGSDTINTGVGGMVAGGKIATDGGTDTVNLQENLINTTIELGTNNDLLKFFAPDGTVVNAKWDGGDQTDTLEFVNTVDISGATVVNFENLVLGNNKNLTLTVAQHSQFTNVTGTGTNQLTFLGAGGSLTTDSSIEVYDLTQTNTPNTVTIGGTPAGGQSILGSFTKDDKVTTSLANLANLSFNGFGDTFNAVLPDFPPPRGPATDPGDVLAISDTGSYTRVIGDGAAGGKLDNVETLDATAGSGNRTLSFAAGTGLKSVITGTGNDTIDTTNLATAQHWVQTDGGNDQVTETAEVNANKVGIDLGADTDTLNLTTKNTLNASTRLLGGTGTDTLNATLTGAAAWLAQNVQSFETVNVTGNEQFGWVAADGDIDSATTINFLTAITGKNILVNAGSESSQNIIVNLTTDAVGTTTLDTGAGNADKFNITLTAAVATDQMQLDGGAGTADELNVSGNFNWASNTDDIERIEKIRWSGNAVVTATFADNDIDNDTTMTVVGVTSKAVTLTTSGVETSKIKMSVKTDAAAVTTLTTGDADDTFEVILTAAAAAGKVLLRGDLGTDTFNLSSAPAGNAFTAGTGDIQKVETVNVAASVGAFTWTTQDSDITGGATPQTLAFATGYNANITLAAQSSNDANWAISFEGTTKSFDIKTDGGNDVVTATLVVANGIFTTDDFSLGLGNDQLILHTNSFGTTLNGSANATMMLGVETLTVDGASTGVNLTLDDVSTGQMRLVDFSGMTSGGATVSTGDFGAVPGNLSLLIKGSQVNDAITIGNQPNLFATVDLSSGGVDTVRESHAQAQANAVLVKGFTAGPVGVGDVFDILSSTGAGLAVAMTPAVVAPNTLITMASSTNPSQGLMLAGNGSAPGEINSQIFGALTDTTNGGAVELAVITSNIIVASVFGGLGILAMDNGVDTGIYQIESNLITIGTLITAPGQFQIKLIGILEGVSDVGTLVANNIQ